MVSEVSKGLKKRDLCLLQRATDDQVQRGLWVGISWGVEWRSFHVG